MTVLMIVVGAGIGAPVRYTVDRFVSARHSSAFPWGTFAVNMAGSFILGLLYAGVTSAPAEINALVGVGFCGALTTYSTFGYETVRLLETRSIGLAAWNAIGSVVLGLASAFAGAGVAGLLFATAPG